MTKRLLASLIIAIVAVAFIPPAEGSMPVSWQLDLYGSAGDGDFAPYYISALKHGKITSTNNIAVEAKAWHEMSSEQRFSYGWGIDLITGYATSNDYQRFNSADKTWTANSRHPARAWVHQLFGEMKYRGIFLTAGLKEHTSALLNSNLTSGDLVESGNSRPIPEVRAGFIDFQNIPFTNGWIQIQGEIGYGKMLDSDWWNDRYNYYNHHITNGEWYNYKRCYFRTKPSMPLSITVGMQAAAIFGGTLYSYSHGNLVSSRKLNLNAKSFWNAFIPGEGGEDFYEGNHLGSWDFMARYTLSGGDEVKAYFQWPWEDGSGIGRRNGWDGLWGVEFSRTATSGYDIFTGAVLEYFDFTNQSGPQHFAPGDFPGTTMVNESTGADDYYNNAYYNSYAYYGMSIGTPAIMAPIYNTDGYPAFVGNRMRGFHAAATGNIIPGVAWRVKAGYRKAWGNGRIILLSPIHLTSVAVDIDWNVKQIKGLKVNGSLAIDRGNMPGNAFGALVTVTYAGSFII